jgi:hypothetical protein
MNFNTPDIEIISYNIPDCDFSELINSLKTIFENKPDFDTGPILNIITGIVIVVSFSFMFYSMKLPVVTIFPKRSRDEEGILINKYFVSLP